MCGENVFVRYFVGEYSKLEDKKPVGFLSENLRGKRLCGSPIVYVSHLSIIFSRKGAVGVKAPFCGKNIQDIEFSVLYIKLLLINIFTVCLGRTRLYTEVVKILVDCIVAIVASIGPSVVTHGSPRDVLSCSVHSTTFSPTPTSPRYFDDTSPILSKPLI